MIKFCKYCEGPFVPERYHQRRNHCYNDACVYEAEQEQMKKVRERSSEHGERQMAERHRKKTKSETCTCCLVRKKKKGNRFLCEVCWNDANSRIDIDYGFGIEQFQKEA